MTIATMRETDRFAGIPLCWLSGLIRRVWRRKSSASVDAILVIKFSGLGSVLLAAPVLHRLRIRFPSARIVSLSFSANRELLDEIHLVDERWFIDPRTVLSFCRTFAVVVGRILRAHIDVVIDFEFFSKFYGPIGNRTINLSAQLPCSPCLSSYNAKAFNCPIDAKCMKEIAVDQVVRAANSLLQEYAARKYPEKVSL